MARPALIAGLARVAGRLASRRPLDAAIRVASSVVGRLEETPLKATPAQQLLLGVAAAQLRAAAGGILVSGERDSVEPTLGDLVSRTLALADAAMAASQPALRTPDDDPSAPPALMGPAPRSTGTLVVARESGSSPNSCNAVTET